MPILGHIGGMPGRVGVKPGNEGSLAHPNSRLAIVFTHNPSDFVHCRNRLPGYGLENDVGDARRAQPGDEFFHATRLNADPVFSSHAAISIHTLNPDEWIVNR